MKKILNLCVIFTIAFQYEAVASTTKPGWQPSFLFGHGSTHAEQTQIVHLADTPEPGLDNRYVAKNTLHDATLFGLGLEKGFDTSFINTIAALGFEIDYLHNKSVKGVVEPMVNVFPDFDVLNYVYHINAVVLQATAKLTKQNIIYKLGGYVQGGLGASFNQLSDYHEHSPYDSSAAPMLSPFGNKNTVSPAFSAGIGVTYKLDKDNSYVSFGYRYIYTGRGSLAESPVQQTDASIKLSPISHQFLMLSVTI